MTKHTAPAGSSAPSTPVRVRFDKFELDEANAWLLRDGKAVALAPTPFAVLCALARQPGSLLSKQALLDAVWGHQFVSESVLKTVISDLRTVLEDDARRPRFIETVSRRGYRFIATTTAAPPQTGPSESTAVGAPHSALATSALSLQGLPFIGRAEALSQLRSAWDRACAGDRAVVWLAGEPGIGKTALIEHFVAGLGDIACARGQCVEQYGTGEPYLSVLEAIAELCRSDAAVATLLRAVAPTWLLQLPWLSSVEERGALRRDLAGVTPDRMLREMGEVLDRYTERRPLLLVTEDLHWSDRATIQLINYIGRRRGSLRLMWLASFRLAEVVALDHPLNSLRHELRLHGLCEEIVLDSFSEREVADYVAERSPALARDESFVRGVHERTDGIPLFVASVMTDVMTRVTQSGDEAAAGEQLASVAVRDNLAAIIDHYVAKLESDERVVLSAAAVCGVDFRVNTVSAALQRDIASVADTCAELARAQLWLLAPRAEQDDDARELPYSFRHALFRQVLYERTPALARAQLHSKVGAALEGERAAGVAVPAVELAVHFERGREPMTALRYYAEAAEAALLHLSPAACMSLTDHALNLLEQAPAGVERSALEIALATLRGVSATHVLGVGSADAKSAFQRAYSLLGDMPQHPMRGLLLHGFGFGLCMRAEYAEALAVAERADALATATNDSILLLSACTVQAEALFLHGRPLAARVWIERGLVAISSLEIDPEAGFVADPQVLLLGLFALQLLHLGLVAQARVRLQEAHARAHQLAQPMARMVAMWCDALVAVRLGEPERVAALADDMRALVDEFALAQGRTACRWFRAWADARMGTPGEAYRRIRDAFEENVRLGMLAGGSETLGYAAEALLLAGDRDAAQRHLEEAIQFANAHEERVYLVQLFLLEAVIARATGQFTAAALSARRAVGEARAQEAPWLELIALVELCEHDSATAEDRRVLAALIDRVPEAIDTKVVTRARALLDKTTAA